MIGKRYSLGSTFETGEARIKVANFDELAGQGDTIATFVRSFTPDPHFTYLHVIAMGAGEYYGPNINGDYFPERDLINRHKTFETNAKVFREHDNKPTSPSYGHVAFSWYNPKMHRVELILAVDNVKGAEFVARQNRGEQLEVSMGCKVAFDVCSICGNKAKRPSDYCSHIRLEKKHIYPDGKQAFMINYNPTFFDISIVRRRADRIAYVLSKVASADGPTSLQDAKADAFDDMLSGFEFVKEAEVFEVPDEDIFDTPELNLNKTASVNDLAKLAMIKRINSNAVRVMNNGMLGIVPVLEQVEPDLPVRILDSIARRFSFADILKSFLLNAIPMKPAEATRIIIIQKGLPPSSFNDVQRGLLSVGFRSGIPDTGSYHAEIGELLRPHLIDRSSFLPAIMHRLSMFTPGQLKTAALNVDIPNNYYDLNPALNFGMVRRPAAYTDVRGDVVNPDVKPMHLHPYAIYPVQMGPQAVEALRNRPKLKDATLSPFETGVALGGLYAAYRNSDFIKKALTDPKSLALLAAAAAVVHATTKSPSVENMQTKYASTYGTVAKWTLPFVGAHLASAHYRNVYNHGGDLNGAERFVAENPDILSIAAPLAINFALRKHASVDNNSVQEDTQFYEKLAAIGDTVADIGDTLMIGMAFGKPSRSLLSMGIDEKIDQAIINQFTGKKDQTSKFPTLNNNN